ncbi:hypothetical protein GGS23DRAFT_106503 [Durotheca rogersii]|uniref:uncharacterized protein n=1 Tax=Durotheca rogersii TaxID=419775 RepID=UPI00221EF311|nr:uncharacterized protein GGS23DRAFT_106503 [Durotheca rogersii]KAI5862115.1 hypothetical protein GGS23DRAFT_106503 [Durotheca rogersii]
MESALFLALPLSRLFLFLSPSSVALSSCDTYLLIDLVPSPKTEVTRFDGKSLGYGKGCRHSRPSAWRGDWRCRTRVADDWLAGAQRDILRSASQACPPSASRA